MRLTSLHAAKEARAANPELRVLAGYQRLENGTRVFWLFKTQTEFAQVVEKSPERRWHEYACPDEPVSLYLDLDDKNKSPDWEQFVARATQVSMRTRPGAEVVRLDANTEEKFSTHLIFPEDGFESPAGLWAYAQETKALLDNDPRFDTQVYSNSPDVFKSLRAPYCVSFGKNNPLIPAGGPPVFDERTFVRCLIGKRPRHIIDVEGVSRKRLRTTVREVDHDLIQAVERVKEFVRLYRGAKTFYLKSPLDKNTGVWVWEVTPGLWCPIKKGLHKSNNTYVRGTIVGGVAVVLETYCLDSDCCVWLPDTDTDWTAVAFPRYPLLKNMQTQ